MAKKTHRWGWRKRMVAVGVLVCVLVLGTLYGFRRRWIAPLPGVRLEMACPIRDESDFGPDSAYRLLMLAAAEPEEGPPPEDADPVWQGGYWTEALTKLKTQAWPGSTPGVDSLWTAAQIADLGRVLACYRPRFALLDRALAAPDFQMPTMRSTSDSLLHYMMPTQRLGKALLLSAHCHAAAGDLAEAYHDLGRAARLGNLLMQGTPVINALLAGAVLRSSCETAWILACRYGGPSPVLREAAADYLACADAMTPVAETMRAEALFAVDSVTAAYASPSGLAANLAPDGLGTGWEPGETTLWLVAHCGWLAGSSQDRATRNARAFLQHVVAAAEQPYSPTVVRGLDDLARSLATRQSAAGVLLGTWDPVGYLMTGHSLTIWRDSLKQLITCRAQMRATALFLAIKAYEQDRGAPPERLEQLVPDYLTRIPDDPFGNRPLHYLRRGVPGLPVDAWAVYSVGENLVDDGGTAHRMGDSRGDTDGGPDLVWPSRPYPFP